MKVYISGPITNDPFYKKHFQEAADKLIKYGHEVVNPAEHFISENATWYDYMKQDIKLLLDCDAIYLLAGYEDSRGAVLEKHIAESMNYKLLYEELY